MDTKEIILTAMESRLVQEFQTLRAAVTKYEMLAAIAKSKDEAWKRATTLKAERKSDAIWAEIEAAVLREGSAPRMGPLTTPGTRQRSPASG